MSNLTKIAIATLGVGTASGAGVAGYLHLSKDDSSSKSTPKPSSNYEDHLKKQGRSLLPQTSNHWATLISKYSAEGDGLLINVNGQVVQKADLREEQLKTWCSQNSSKSFTDAKNENYQRVSAWCTEPKTISQLLQGKTALNDTETSGGTRNVDEEEWTKKVEKYKNNQNKDLIKEMTSENQEGGEIATENFNDVNKLRKWCKFSKSKHFKHEEDSRYLKYLTWCTK